MTIAIKLIAHMFIIYQQKIKTVTLENEVTYSTVTYYCIGEHHHHIMALCIRISRAFHSHIPHPHDMSSIRIQDPLVVLI